MPRPVDDAVRDVTLLMMVRYMPEDDFLRLCDGILPVANTAAILTPPDTLGHLLTPPDTQADGPSCESCGDPVEAGALICKACLDEALWQVFGPQDDGPLDEETNALIRRALLLAAGAHA